MFFGTPIMAENITLFCTNEEDSFRSKVYIRFNDEEQTIKASSLPEGLRNLPNQSVVHWSDKLIIFVYKGPMSRTKFIAGLSALDRVTGRLQQVDVTARKFDTKKKELFIFDCELFDREKPKF